ncbi:hypothetical protein [Cupriavidus basilensis]
MSKSSKKVAVAVQSTKQSPRSRVRERLAEKETDAAAPYPTRRDVAKWGPNSGAHSGYFLDRAQFEHQIASLIHRRNKGIIEARSPRRTARTAVAGHFCWVVEDVEGQRREYLELCLFHSKLTPEGIDLCPAWRLPCVRQHVEPRSGSDTRPSDPFAMAVRLFDALFTRKGGAAF